MRTLLDNMFYYKRLSFILPLALALLMYVVFVLFGTAEDKTRWMIITPIASAVWFFGVFFVVFIQVKNSGCPERFLNVFELSATILFGLYAIISAISFIASGFQHFHMGVCLGFVTYSAVSWAHSKRT